MTKIFSLFLFFVILTGSPENAKADEILASYFAKLSVQDHFNSSGQRLTTAAAVLRQDRANFHRFGKRDSLDDWDGIFHRSEARNLLEEMLLRGHSHPEALSSIVNDTPMVRVTLRSFDNGALCLEVEVIEDFNSSYWE